MGGREAARARIQLLFYFTELLLNIPRASWWMILAWLNGRTSLYRPMCACVLKVFSFCYIIYKKYSARICLVKKNEMVQLGCETKILSPKNLSSSPPKIKLLNESWLLWNQQPIRNKNKRWLVETRTFHVLPSSFYSRNYWYDRHTTVRGCRCGCGKSLVESKNDGRKAFKNLCRSVSDNRPKSIKNNRFFNWNPTFKCANLQNRPSRILSKL